MQYKTLKEIAEANGIQYHTLYARLMRSDHVRIEKAGNVILVHEDDIPLLTHEVGPPSPRTHGMTGTKIYSRWTSLLHYHRDDVCQRWFDFEAFLEDMGEPPTHQHKLHRKDPTAGWDASNCEWKLK